VTSRLRDTPRILVNATRTTFYSDQTHPVIVSLDHLQGSVGPQQGRKVLMSGAR